MKCIDCPHFDKDEGECSKDPASIEEVVCLLRWIIGLQLVEDDETDEGEEWKQ